MFRRPTPWSAVVASKPSSAKIDTIVALCKRRGFVFASGEIYGGTRSAWDYGPLGTELKENIKRQWWKTVVTGRDDVVGLDSSVILPRQVWVASGHVNAFHDPLVECKHCHQRFRADQLAEYTERTGKPASEDDLSDIPCPNCGTRGQFTPPREFNMMLKTFLGPVESEEGMHYLRPETAQGIFINFLNVQTTARRKPPFGIGQVGKSFRNEITPGNFIFRTREFEQMEMEYFVEPGTDEELHQYWIDERTNWYVDLGIARENLRHYEHPKEKLSHYSKRTVDIEYRFGFTGQEWGELEGVANRTDFDLTTHSTHSEYGPVLLRPGDRHPLPALRDRAGRRSGPLDDGVPRRRVRRRPGAEREGRGRHANRVAAGPPARPVKAAVLPLSRNADLSPKARDLAAALRKHWNVDFDDAGAIGRRYRRQDEIGTPFCVTVDFDTLDDQSVTVRERDSMAQGAWRWTRWRATWRRGCPAADCASVWLCLDRRGRPVLRCRPARPCTEGGTTT